MARPTKRRIEPAGTTTVPPSKRSDSGRTKPKGREPGTSRRYTPPNPSAHHRPSPLWVPVVMFGFFGLGFLAIFLNYTDVLPGAPSGWWLVGGLGAILAGIITATQLR